MKKPDYTIPTKDGGPGQVTEMPRLETYLDHQRRRYNVVIPFNSPAKYHWWNGGQSVFDTVTELVLNEAMRRKTDRSAKEYPLPDYDGAVIR